MKKVDLRQTIGILANVGVIAGIVFLGLELRQNNELIAAEAEFNRLSLVTDSYGVVAESSELPALFVKDRNGEELTEEEFFRIESHWMRVLHTMHWRYRELPDDTTWIEGHRRNFAEYSTLRRTWQSTSGTRGKHSFDPEFVQFMEGNVVNQR